MHYFLCHAPHHASQPFGRDSLMARQGNSKQMRRPEAAHIYECFLQFGFMRVCGLSLAKLSNHPIELLNGTLANSAQHTHNNYSKRTLFCMITRARCNNENAFWHTQNNIVVIFGADPQAIHKVPPRCRGDLCLIHYFPHYPRKRFSGYGEGEKYIR